MVVQHNIEEFTALDANIEDDDVMSPNTWQPTNPTLDSTNGIGRYIARVETHHVATRGGGVNGADAGVFALFFRSEADTVLPLTSFRCVYRP